jgi:hypothetical protein
VLTALTGADDEQQARSAVTPTNAARLRIGAPRETLLDVALTSSASLCRALRIATSWASRPNSKLMDRLNPTREAALVNPN